MNIINSVTFFGSSKAKSEDEEYKQAQQAAEIVARSGRRVVNGGGPGIMLAATLGAQTAGGKTTAVYYEPELATYYEGKTAVNIAEIQYKEANYVDRTQRLLELGDLYIIFNGGTGTISEFGMAWGLARLYFGHHKPLILFGEFWHQIIKAFEQNMRITPKEFSVFRIISDSEKIIPVIEEFEKIIHHNRQSHISENHPESYLLL